MQAARKFIRTHGPGLRETVKYGVPFFVGRRPAIYLNPSGKAVWMGFAEGAQMIEFHPVFDEVLKTVAKVRIESAKDLRKPGLAEAVTAAAEAADEQ
jgi:hypothetical protein